MNPVVTTEGKKVDDVHVVEITPVVPAPDDDSKALPSYKRPLPLTTQVLRFIVVFLLSVLVLAAGLLVANARMPDPKEVRPLPDILIELIPKIRWLETFTDVVIFLMNVSTVFVVLKVYVLGRREMDMPDVKILNKVPYVGAKINDFLFKVIDSGKRPYPVANAYLIILVRFLATYSVMMLYRTVIISMTSYPATDNHCQNPQVIEKPLLNMLLTLVTLGSGAIHCGDLMFSGHTIILSLTWVIIWEYSPFIHGWIFRVYSTVLILFSFFCIIASRSHYTNDILVSLYGTITTFLVIRHSQDGAPWQLQLSIRWWPCLGSNSRNDDVPEDVVTTADEYDTVAVPIDGDAPEDHNPSPNPDTPPPAEAREESAEEHAA